MKKNKYIWLVLLLFVSLNYLKAQTFSASGKIDPAFLEIINYQGIDGEKFKSRTEKKFAVVLDYKLHNFLNSGKVIYNCQASEYIEKVADNLLRNQPKLRGEINFYIVKSTDVNAFTYHNGMVFINIGLLANVKTEAQLAFILAHEISHYQLKHSFQKYKQSKIEQKRAARSNGSGADAFIRMMSYSRETELEADNNGLKLFLQSEYATKASLDVIKGLEFADYPIENKEILRESFETPFFKISPLIFPDTASTIVSHEADEDSLVTHPNIKTRIAALKKGLDGVNQNKGSEFILEASQFHNIRNAARKELSNLYLEEGDFISAFYNSYILLQEKPNDKDLLVAELKSLFFIQNYINENLKSKITVSPKKIKGELQKLHSFFKKSQKSDMNAFVLRLSWRLRHELGDDADGIKFSNFCIREFGANVSNQLNHFKPISEYQDSLFIHNYEINKNAPNKTMKTNFKALRKKSDYKHVSISHFAMSDFLDDKNFKTIFEEQVKLVELKGADDNDKGDSEEEKIEKDVDVIAKKKSKKKEKPLIEEAITNLLVIDINNLFYDLRKDDPLIYLTVKEKEQMLMSLIKKTGELNGVKVSVFNPSELSSNDSALFTERVILNNWLSKIHDEGIKFDFSDSKEQALIKRIMEKYNTKHLCFINSIAELDYRDNLDIDLRLFLLSFLLPPLPIYFGYRLFNPAKASAIYIPVYNMENGKIIYTHEQSYKDLNRIDYTRSEFYNFFYIISKNAYK
ncbi:MAG: M48 family metallopeptidase [Bacteroidia bacterium]